MQRWRTRWSGAGASRFARNVFQIARANLVAQALPVLAAPLLTRLYSPADFGALAVFASLLGPALAIATLRFDWSLPNTRSTAQAAAVLALGAMALAAATLITAIALGLSTAGVLPALAIGPVAWLLVPALLGGGLQQLLAAWHVRSAELAALGRAKVTQSAANVATSLVLVPLLTAGQGPWGLAAGVLAGAWVGLRTLWRGAPDLQRALGRLSARRLGAAWSRFRSEAGWSTLVSVCNAASFAIVPLLLARHYGGAEVGFYALMQRVALAPVGLVGAAVSQSFWAEAARLVRDDPPALRRLYLANTRRLAGLALALTPVALAGPWYVGPLFGGAAWSAAGLVLAASTPMLIGQVIVSPLSHLVVHRRQRWQAAWDTLRVLLLALVIEGLGGSGAPFVSTVLALSLVMAAMYALLFGLNLRAARRV